MPKTKKNKTSEVEEQIKAKKGKYFESKKLTKRGKPRKITRRKKFGEKIPLFLIYK